MVTEATTGSSRGIGLIDWAMVALAVFSVGLLTWVTFWRVPLDTQYTVFVVDASICGIFFVEFLWRWHKYGWTWQFLLRNWYEILGMVPVTHPAFRGFRLVRVIVILMRLGGAADRLFGEYFTHRLVNKLTNAVVSVIKKPVTVAVLDEVVEVLQTGHYTHNIARALRENEDEIRSMVLEKVRQDPQTGRFKSLPFYNDLVVAVSDTAMRVVLEVLADERTDELVSDALRENVEQIRYAVRNNEHANDKRTEAAAIG